MCKAISCNHNFSMNFSAYNSCDLLYVVCIDDDEVKSRIFYYFLIGSQEVVCARNEPKFACLDILYKGLNLIRLTHIFLRYC